MRVLIPIDGGADCREAIRFVTSRKSWLENQKPQIELLYVKMLSRRVRSVTRPRLSRATPVKSVRTLL